VAKTKSKPEDPGSIPPKIRAQALDAWRAWVNSASKPKRRIRDILLIAGAFAAAVLLG
jgi:hypothetical protein